MRSVARTAAVLAVVSLAIAPEEASAQVWSLDAYAGRAHYEAAPASVHSNTGVLGVRFNEDRRFFQSALGIPFTGTDVTWGVLGAGDRFAVRRGAFTTGLDVSVLGHAQRDPVAEANGQGIAAELIPTFSRSLASGVLEVRSGPRWYASRHGDASWTRTLWTNELRGSVQATEQVWLEGEVRHDRSREREAYTRVGFSVLTIVGPTTLEGSAGHWAAGTHNTGPEWGVSFAVAITPKVWIFTAAQRETFNPQFLSAPRTSWGGGVTFRLGGGRTQPTPTPPEISPAGQVEIRIPVQDTSTPPSIAGDFTGWTPVLMERRGEEWRYVVNLSPGVYRYAFRTADGEWFVPQTIPGRTDDGMGGWVAVLVVP